MRYIAKRKKIIAFILAGCLSLVFCMNVFADFPDVSINHTNYEAIDALVEKGVIAGYDDGYFRPEKEITRTEFCALMARTLGYQKDEYQANPIPFSDVSEGYWGTDYISFCYELGLINGMGDGTFWPAEKVTLAQTVKMAVCAIGEQEKALLLEGEKWYDGYVKVAEEYDLFYMVDGQLDKPSIRSDVAQIVYNMTKIEPISPDDEENQEEISDEADLDGEQKEEDHIPPEIRAAYKEKDFSKVKTILIDAGHNYFGKDIGAENVEFNLREEEITWQIADRLKDYLLDEGYEVIMTRDDMKDSIGNTSVMESLGARVDLGHQSLADLFISIHCNAGGGSGTEVYCFQKKGYAYRLAQLVQENIAENTTLYNRGVKTANFFVIQNTLMPAILIETGFIDNENDIEVIASKSGQKKIAKAIFDAVVLYDSMDPIKMTEELKGNENDEETGTSGPGGEPQ